MSPCFSFFLWMKMIIRLVFIFEYQRDNDRHHQAKNASSTEQTRNCFMQMMSRSEQKKLRNKKKKNKSFDIERRQQQRNLHWITLNLYGDSSWAIKFASTYYFFLFFCRLGSSTQTAAIKWAYSVISHFLNDKKRASKNVAWYSTSQHIIYMSVD